jgi:predicted nucleotidyltransferase component of viral defense system
MNGMIDLIRAKLTSLEAKEDKYNYLREYLQILILSILDNLGYFRQIAFVGGTALRIVYKINRYSEDLDFSLINAKTYDFQTLLEKILSELKLRGFDVSVKQKEPKQAVHSTFIRFAQVLNEFDLSTLKDEKLSIKFDIDTNPPLGHKTQLSSYDEPFIFNINHFDKASLMAGKLHAILQRKFDKGRDYYDLLWYLSGRVEPNLELLNNALKQTMELKSDLNTKTWRSKLLTKLKDVDLKKMQSDVEPFLMFASEINNINYKNFERLLSVYEL